MSEPRDATRRITLAGVFSADLVPGILFAIAMAVLTPRLGVPDGYIFDEVYHAYTAGQYVAGNADAYVWYTHAPREHVAYMWNHPPAGVLFMAGGILIWGDNAFGWRFASAVFGASGVVLAYLLAYAMTRRKVVAVAAAGMLLFDGLYFVQSRIGMLDIYGVVFMLGAFYALHGYLTAPPERVRNALLKTGLFVGLAIATKWNAAYAGLLIGLTAIVRGVMSGAAGRRVHLVWVPLALIALPAAIYMAAYVPFFATGHDLGQFVQLQKQIFWYHSHLEATHPYQSSWWQWPLTLRPAWYYAAWDKGTVANIYANGNSVLYLAFLPALSWVGFSWARRRDPSLTVLLIGFFGQWLPWALVPRIAFVYHFLPAVPFGCIAIAVALGDLVDRGRAGRVGAGVYLALVVAFFVWFYPIYAAIPISDQAFQSRLWLSSWK